MEEGFDHMYSFISSSGMHFYTNTLTNNPQDENNHLMDAWRYSCNDLWKQTKAKVLKR